MRRRLPLAMLFTVLVLPCVRPCAAQDAPRIKVVSEAEAAGTVKEVYQKSLHDFNKVYNYQRILSLNPTVLAAVEAMYRDLMLAGGEITQRERFLIAGIVAARDGDRNHVRILQEYLLSLPGGGQPWPDFATGSYKDRKFSPKEETLFAFAVKVHDAPAKVTDEDVRKVRDLGLSDRAISDVVSLVSVARLIATASVALGAPPEPWNRGEGIVRGRSYDIPFEHGDSHYDAILSASDGKVYFACCTHHIDEHAQFFSFDPATKKVTHIADVGEIVGEKGSGAITQGKVHSYIFEYRGKLWFSTFKGYYNEDLRGRKPYPGGHFLSYDMKTGRFEKLATVPEGEGIPTCYLDTVHEKFYGVTYPAGHLYVYDLKTRELECIERGKLHYGCGGSVDPQGRLWLNRPKGGMVRYDPTRPKGERLEELPVRTDDGAYGPAEKGAGVALIWGEKDGVFGVHGGTASFCRFDPATYALAPLARLSAGEKRRCLVNFRGTQPGFPRAADGTFYHVPVGPPYDDPPKPLLKYNCYLTGYNPAADTARNYGPVYFEYDRRMLYNGAGTLSPDGRSFVTVGWVEVNDAARIEKVRQLRAESSPPETARRIYELRLVEIPLP